MSVNIIEETAYSYAPGIYKLMLQGFNLDTIVERTDLNKSFILSLFKSESFHLHINIIGIYYHIYSITNPLVMKGLLDGFTSKLINDMEFFKDPENYIRDFFYIDSQWCKKDLNDCIVETFEPLPLPEHHDDEWFKILRKRHQLMLSEHFG